MDITQFMSIPGEKPLDRILTDGGFCGIFRTVGCIGDSLSSGEFESKDENGNNGYHDMFEYSWGQYIARAAGLKAYNFSRGGMTASEYWNSFANQNGFWDADKLCQAYIIALGVNDILNAGQTVGSVADINTDDYNKNANTFAGYYARIIQRLKAMQPKACFFLMTMPCDDGDEAHIAKIKTHRKLLYDIAGLFDFTYILDFTEYAPIYDHEFRRNFFLGGHLNAAGYLLTARMTASYIDYIIRHNPRDFAQVGFIGTPFSNNS
ncbi:MAG: SGNH/GDSL hydrolase family protein [Eubacteriales bacterium]|jgi:lysophospholipase L1-like esterase|nr:SGNH/GDSL hydrolase family protein [Eubacteriales bacterium]